MPFSDRQLQALAALDWLLDPGMRGTGRSYVMAVALIRQAAQSPRRRVYFHEPSQAVYPNGMHRRILSALVGDLVGRDPLLAPGLQLRNDFFVLDLPDAIHAWLPSPGSMAVTAARQLEPGQVNLDGFVVGENPGERIAALRREIQAKSKEPVPPEVRPSVWDILMQDDDD